MKKIVLSLSLLLSAGVLFAQEVDKDTLSNGWYHSGNFSLMVNQSAFNANWQEGGTSNYAGNLKLDYGVIYKKDRLIWDNNLRAEFGMTKNKGEEFTRKTADRLEINSVVGYETQEDSNWYYSFFANFRTQFAKGYDYDKVDITDPSTGDVLGSHLVRTESSRFMSPGYLRFGPGILYKNGARLKINFAPLTSRFIFVDDRFTTLPGYQDGDYYGVDKGKNMRYELGMSVDISSKLEIVKNVEMTNLLSLYSDYLDNPQNIDIDYTLNLAMKINEWLSANFIFQAIYDDNTVGAFQVREGLGIGFSYKLD